MLKIILTGQAKISKEETEKKEKNKLDLQLKIPDPSHLHGGADGRN